MEKKKSEKSKKDEKDEKDDDNIRFYFLSKYFP
jgi:hypothetical protein